MNAEELRKVAINNYSGTPVEEIIKAINSAAGDGKCSINFTGANGDTLCHILRQKIEGVNCSSVYCSDGWHTNVCW